MIPGGSSVPILLPADLDIPASFDAVMARRYADVGVRRLVFQAQTSQGLAIDDLIESASDTLIG